MQDFGSEEGYDFNGLVFEISSYRYHGGLPVKRWSCVFQVLMLIDASFGFEMETFEFLNICQVHGFPKIMGILTHLDTFKNNKQLKKTKKKLKHRFWTEVYPVWHPAFIFCILCIKLGWIKTKAILKKKKKKIMALLKSLW